MIDIVNEVLRHLSRKKGNSVTSNIEINLISRYRDKLEWQSLSSVQKQEKRKSVLESIKKYKEEDGLASYTYENAVVNFYDESLRILEELNELESNILIKRLVILLRIDLESIDSDSRLINKNVSPSFVYESVISDIVEAEFMHASFGNKIIEYAGIISPSSLPSNRL